MILIFNSMSDSTPPKPLCEFSSPEWIAEGVEGDDKEYEPFPHLRFGISHDTNGDNRLLRGELLAIMRLMMGRFRPKAFANHCVIPVSLSSKYSSDSVANVFEGIRNLLHGSTARSHLDQLY